MGQGRALYEARIGFDLPSQMVWVRGGCTRSLKGKGYFPGEEGTQGREGKAKGAVCSEA